MRVLCLKNVYILLTTGPFTVDQPLSFSLQIVSCIVLQSWPVIEEALYQEPYAVNGLCCTTTAISRLSCLPDSMIVSRSTATGKVSHLRCYWQCWGSGSEIRCFFDPWIRDPGWGKNPEIIFFESLETVFRVNNSKILDEDPGSGISRPWIWINIPDPQHWLLVHPWGSIVCPCSREGQVCPVSRSLILVPSFQYKK